VKAPAAAALAACVALAPRAMADPALGVSFGPGPARAISEELSAWRDAPVFEYAYGPRAQASLGGELSLYTNRREESTFRLGLSALAAFENGASKSVLPDEVYRTRFGVTFAFSADRLARRWLGEGAALELSLLAGFEHDGQASSYVPDAPRPWDIPFGETGLVFQPEIALRAPLGRRIEVTTALRDRLTASGLAAAVGARVASDIAAGYLDEGLLHVPGAEVDLRWRAFPRGSPVLSLAGEQFIPLAPARTGFFVRALLGAALGGSLGEVVPFVSFDAGNGSGMLIDRREARLSFGVRYAPF
jgi:hypothetical protein